MIKINSWWPWYLIFSLSYICWMVYLGTNDFKKIQRDYRRARYYLTFDQVEKSAIHELTRECLKKSAQVQESNDLCLSHSPKMVQTKIQYITKLRTQNMNQASKKRLMFYTSFGIVFIISPLASLYVAILIVMKLRTTVKLVK